MQQLWAGALAASLMASPDTAVQAAVNPLPKTEIVIDVGHGGVDSGTLYGKILEKDINLAVGLKLYSELRSRNVAVSINRTKDYALSDDNLQKPGSRHRRDLAQRVEIANRLKPAFMLSLHVNWTSNRAKSGPLVIYRKNHEPSKLLAARLQKELNALYGMNVQPEPSRKYYVLTRAHIPTVIVEMGFLSNKHDRELLISPAFQQKLAGAISNGAVESLREDFSGRSAVKRKK
jgi:N-acetylmuramoyl-L-alanine amidase